MDIRLKRLYDEIEYDQTHGVYRPKFFDIVGPVLRENREKSALMRRALGFKALMEQYDLKIRKDEVLLGTLLGCYPRVDMPDYEKRKEEAHKVIQKYLKTESGSDKTTGKGRGLIYGRMHELGNIQFDQLQKIIAELTAEFAGKGLERLDIARELERHFTFDFGEDGRTVNELPWEATNHNDINPPRFLGLGLGGIRDEILECQKNCTPDKEEFYEAELMTIDAVIGFFKRYAQIALDEADKPSCSAQRRKELHSMAKTMEKVSYHKPETFHEAIQMVWMMYIISNLQAPQGSCSSYARFDQYLYPFYQADIEANRITEDEAVLYIGNLFCKVNEPRMRSVVSLIIGGVTPEGKEASNDITRLCLIAAQQLKQPYPNLTVRCCKDTPEWLYDLVSETIKMGFGNPMVVNDEVYIPNLVRLGFPLEDARDYYNMGCVENMIMGRTPIWLGVNQMDFAGTINQTLSGGEMDATHAYLYMAPVHEDRRLYDIDALDTFDKFLEAYKNQMRFNLRDTKEKCDLQDEMLFSSWCDPFGTLVMDGCIKKGKDIYKGGCKFGPMKPVKAIGLGTAVDSLAAIKKFVYDEKKFSLRQFRTMLEANFAGHENERAMLSNYTPCYGNDNPETDAIAQEIFQCFCDTVHDVNKQGIFGYACVSLFSFIGHITVGEVVGATPNGRLRGTPVSDTMGPSQGKDVSGPTCVLKSALSLNSECVTGAYALNIKLNPASLRGKTGTENLKAMIKAYLKNNGVQLQFNFVDTKTLLAAKKEPEKYQSLVVRVAGYCEYFNNLDANMQDEIISRTMHEFA